MQVKHYQISSEENRKCDSCGGEASIERLSADSQWETLKPPVFFAVQTDLNFLKVLRRWCEKCNKHMEIKYRSMEE